MAANPPKIEILQHPLGGFRSAGQRKPASDGLNSQNLPLIPPGSLLFAPSRQRLVHSSARQLFHIENHVFAFAKAFEIFSLFFPAQSSSW